MALQQDLLKTSDSDSRAGFFEKKKAPAKTDADLAQFSKAKIDSQVNQKRSSQSNKYRQPSSSLVAFNRERPLFYLQPVLVCSPSERRNLIQLTKRGLTNSERRDCWLLATGALQAMSSAQSDYYNDLLSHC